MFIVTGGAGFIGANLIAELNRRGITQILVVDNLKNSIKFRNLIDLKFDDYLDKHDFLNRIQEGDFDQASIQAIFHQGACSDTMEYDGSYMMENNYNYSKILFHFAIANKIPFIYASSAATYGASIQFSEDQKNEGPLNIYGYSKLLFDRYVQRHLPDLDSPVSGLRYFNVYGPREHHKGRMASMVYQLRHQLQTTSIAPLFEGSGGYGPGEQRRDFIFVNDVAQVNLFLAEGPLKKGIFNVGTGTSRPFNDIAHILIAHLGLGTIQYKPMPDTLKDKYQSFTEAEITRLRATGYDLPFTTLEEGIRATLASPF
ncbi:MAG: ADP-glyceromanno-heptose 6-epimerase [Magnetococcus sp. DMHC-6]